MLQKSKQLLKKVIRKSLYVYPGNWRIHRKLAIFLGGEKKWKQAVLHWDKVYKNRKAKLFPENYLQYATALKNNNKDSEAIEILMAALSKYPTNKQVILALSHLFTSKKKWQQASGVLIKLFEIEDVLQPVTAYNDLATSYVKQGLFDRAMYIVGRGIQQFPGEESLINCYANIAIHQRKWDMAVNRLEHLQSIYADNMPMDSLIMLSMLYQLKGDNRKAANLFQHVLKKHKQEIDTDKKGYRKIVLFDNGESRIEFYKNLKKVNQVVVTFDSLYMDWDEPSFGFNFILRQDADIVAVRKRKKGESQQYLTQEEFVETVQLLVDGYSDKVAYGHSLGGYTALYYASKLNCRILSLAPRISIHPIYGKKSAVEKQPFQHHLSHDFNEQISPIIVYDPKDKLDSTYVHNELLVSYPNAQLVKMHYGGHGIARHLLRMGLLKKFLLAVLEGEVPKYDRSLKSNSANYCRLLGRECLRRNKIKWAWDLCERSVQLLPKDRHVIKFRVDMLIKLNKMDEAIAYAKQSVRKVPNNLHVRLILIDLYIGKGELIYAEREVKAAVKKFKASPKLTKRMTKIDSMWGEAALNYFNSPDD